MEQGARHPINKPNLRCPQLGVNEDLGLGLATSGTSFLTPDSEYCRKKVQCESPLGARYPIDQPNTRGPRLEVHDDKSGNGLAKENVKAGGVPNPNLKKRKPAGRPWYEHLTGYVGWLRRIEKEEWKASKNRGKEDAKEAKISFLRRFYPEVSHSPGGSVKLKGGDDIVGPGSAINGRKERQEDPI